LTIEAEGSAKKKSGGLMASALCFVCGEGMGVKELLVQHGLKKQSFSEC